MVELGEIQDAENAKIAAKAAGICDLVAVVGETNRSAILQGLKEGGMGDDKILLFDSRDAALAKLNSLDFRQSKDLVLIENDLPDLYEAEVKF
jgi:UDP-N-acetylmuramyl pentapeptide synthase